MGINRPILSFYEEEKIQYPHGNVIKYRDNDMMCRPEKSSLHPMRHSLSQKCG